MPGYLRPKFRMAILLQKSGEGLLRRSKAEQARSSLAKWVNNESSQKESHGDTDRNLYDREPNVQRNRVDGRARTHIP
jgi:hypothetical protein